MRHMYYLRLLEEYVRNPPVDGLTRIRTGDNDRSTLRHAAGTDTRI